MFNNYYKRLEEYYWDNVPDYAWRDSWEGYFTTIYEQWGGLMWCELLHCGKVSTYPKKMVEQYLKELGAVKVEFKNVVPFEDEVNNTIDAWFELPLDEEFIQKLKDALFRLGWKIKQQDNDRIVIDPMFPVEYIPDNPKNFYYITSKEHVNEILEVGLPMKSREMFSKDKIKELFYHPTDRFYICQINNMDKLGEIVKSLADEEWVLEDTVLLNVDIEGLKMFQDPLFHHNDDYKMCFTPDNIPPNRIIKTLP